MERMVTFKHLKNDEKLNLYRDWTADEENNTKRPYICVHPESKRRMHWFGLVGYLILYQHIIQNSAFLPPFPNTWRKVIYHYNTYIYFVFP